MVRPTKKSRKTAELGEYRRKRDFSATPEPSADGDGQGDRPRFVVQEHSATRLHWDLRLERDGVAVSWAVPNGIPELPGENRMAVHTEDHPLEYLSWEGVIPKGNYGAGTMKVWDHGTYETHEWTDTKATVTFHGERVSGRYHLFHIGGRGGNDWMIRRVDPPLDPGRQPLPQSVAVVAALPGTLPAREDDFAFEIRWDGRRALAFCEPGRLRLEDARGQELTALYPELGRLTRSIGAHTAVLDGEVIALGDDGRPDPARLARRAKPGTDSAMRRRARDIPVVYEIYDLLFLDGHPLEQLPWAERRARLGALDLDGEHWRVSQHHEGDGAALLVAAGANGLPGIVAKRLDSSYEPGWVEIAVEESEAAGYYSQLAHLIEPHLAGRRASRDGDAIWIEDLERPAAVRFTAGDPDTALLLNGTFGGLGLSSLAKTGAGGELEVWLPLGEHGDWDAAEAFAAQVADVVRSARPRAQLGADQRRPWLAPYSLVEGGVSAPVTWEEVATGDRAYGSADVAARVERDGDLFAPALSLAQELPR